MPRAPAKIRRRYIQGQTEVLDWQVEETLVYGCAVIIGPPCMFRSIDEWQREWARWGDVILPKVIEHRPGTRPFAMYATGMIPARELRMPLPLSSGYWAIDVRHRDHTERHYIDVPEPWVEAEVKHLRRLGIVDDREYRRHLQWMQERNPDCDRCAVDTYPLEMSVYE
jgi:hypothetical protein